MAKKTLPHYYKYLPKEYANELVEKGIIKINTLYGCRKIENCSERQDIEEGITKHKAKGMTINPDGTRNIRVAFHNMTPKTITFTSDGYNLSSPNAYIYCLSSERSSQIMECFNGTDTCVEINNIEKFARIISYKLVDLGLINEGYPAGFWQCVYRDRNFGEDPNKTQGFLIKDSKYQHQKEWRLAWFPLEPSTSMLDKGTLYPVSKDFPIPEPFECKEIIDLCNIVDC